VPGGALLVSAYAFVMVLLVGYVARLGALQSKTAAEVERLTRALERGKPE
jgi:CcmD family protein